MATMERELPDMKDAQTTVDGEIASAKETMDLALQAASRAGYITSSDFGFFAAKAIKDNVIVAPNDAKPCD